jgi:hypothetical protein
MQHSQHRMFFYIGPVQSASKVLPMYTIRPGLHCDWRANTAMSLNVYGSPGRMWTSHESFWIPMAWQSRMFPVSCRRSLRRREPYDVVREPARRTPEITRRRRHWIRASYQRLRRSVSGDWLGYRTRTSIVWMSSAFWNDQGKGLLHPGKQLLTYILNCRLHGLLKPFTHA